MTSPLGGLQVLKRTRPHAVGDRRLLDTLAFASLPVSQRQMAARQGVPLALSTLAEWVGRLGVALQPLADRLAELQRQRPVLHADETPVRQLDPGGGKTRTAYLWAYRSNGLDGEPPILLFDYQTSREGKHAASFLRGWQGHLMVDDYAGYKALFRDGAVVELACLAHARRKFFDLAKANGSPIAARALRHIARLYRIEAQVQDASPRVRQHWRAKYAQPRLRLYHAWLVKTRAAVPDGTGIAKALDAGNRGSDAKASVIPVPPPLRGMERCEASEPSSPRKPERRAGSRLSEPARPATGRRVIREPRSATLSSTIG